MTALPASPETDTEFSLVYDGPALQGGEMEVGDLAPALLALRDLFDEANEVVGQPADAITLTVRAGFRRGSFVVDLHALKAVWDGVVSLFSSPNATAIANILAIVGISGGIGLIQLIRRSGGKAPKRVVEVTETRSVRIEFEGEPPIDLDARVWRLFQNPKARGALGRVVAPLRKPGIDSVRFRTGAGETRVADTGDVEAFEPEIAQEGEVVSESRRVLQLVSPSFRDGNKWRVSEGGRTLYVSVLDEAFLGRVRRRDELFGDSDFLDVDLRTRQWVEAGQLRVSHEVLKVYRKSGSAQQLMLGFDG
jgi:hypothetical protein